MRAVYLLLPLWLTACAPSADEQTSDAFSTAQAPLPTQALMLVGGPSATTLSLTVEMADDAEEQERGLMFRARMADGHGMLFVWPNVRRNVFWMKNTPEPLDLLFFQQGTLVATIAHAKPFDETPLDPGMDSDWVLEVPAGFAVQHQLLPNWGWRGTLLPTP